MKLPYTFRDIGPPISSEDLDKLEQELCCKLPESYRSFMLTTNGGFPDHQVFEEPGLESLVVRSLHPLGGPMPFELKNMNIHGNDFPKGLLEIGDSVCGDPLALGITGEHFGKVYWQDHEQAEDPEDWSCMNWMSDDFGEFMLSLKSL
ncbi:MAG: SMI1/KNR4 family protein [Verrucomicrobiaceae bacterium]|nr:SMI1/KNR4 family protein [Verrucomicrobiaceae bacterium]